MPTFQTLRRARAEGNASPAMFVLGNERAASACVDTAKDQLALFLIGYLFSKRAKDGIAPIEAIWPEAVYTPLYQIFNGLGIQPDYVKQMPKMANESSSYLLQA